MQCLIRHFKAKDYKQMVIIVAPHLALRKQSNVKVVEMTADIVV